MNNATNALSGLVSTIEGWINNIFGYFGFYTQNYSKLIVYGVLLFIVSKFVKLNFKVDSQTGGRHRK